MIKLNNLTRNEVENKAISLLEKDLRKIPLDYFPEYIEEQVKELASLYDKLLSERYSYIVERMQVVSEAEKKLDYIGLESTQKEIEEGRKQFAQERSEAIKKRNLIEEKFRKLNKNLETIQFSNTEVLACYHTVKGFYENKVFNLKNLNKTSHEIKSETFNLLKLQDKKQILTEKLDPTFIQKDLLAKEDIFSKNLNSLIRNLREEDQNLKKINAQLENTLNNI